MSRLKNISNENYEYAQYNDYVFKQTIKQKADGVLKFLNIPYKLKRISISEITAFGPKIYRLDFVSTVDKNGEEITLIFEFQTKLPTEDDFSRFFQYVSNMRTLKKQSVEIFILCLEDIPYTKKEYKLNDDCTFIMNLISLKDFKAKEILKSIEDKIKNKEEITDEDIASLELIIYTDYTESKLEIIEKTYNLVLKLDINDNEKDAIIYILNILSANMLDENDKKEYMENHNMLINPRDEYLVNKTREESKKEINKLKKEIEENKKEIEKNKKEIKENKKELEENKKEIKENKKEIEKNKKEIKENKKELEENKKERLSIAQQLLNEKIPIEKISKITKIPINQIQNTK